MATGDRQRRGRWFWAGALFCGMLAALTIAVVLRHWRAALAAMALCLVALAPVVGLIWLVSHWSS
jgi:hypothetical protein